MKYLEQLASDGCLLFVAPQARFRTLGRELMQRCEQAHSAPFTAGQGEEESLMRVDSRSVALVSWRLLLERLRSALSEAADAHLAADVDQLAGLCEREDSAAFLPLTPHDLSNPTPLRVHQYMQLVDSIVQYGVNTGRLSTQGLRAAPTLGRYLRYARADKTLVALSMDLLRWANERLTPLWLELAVIANPGGALSALEDEPRRVFYDGYRNRPVVALDLPLHAEEQTVVTAVLAQIANALDQVRDCPPAVEFPSPASVQEVGTP